jgi:hypothetical protein
MAVVSGAHAGRKTEEGRGRPRERKRMREREGIAAVLSPRPKGLAAARITWASINDGHSATELVHCLEVGDEAVGWAGPLLGFG